MDVRVTRSVLVEREEQTAAALIAFAILAACLLNPGLALGGLATLWVWPRAAVGQSVRWLVAALGAATVAVLHATGTIVFGWTWLALHGGAVSPRSFVAEMAAGPAAVQLAVLVGWLRRRALMHHLRAQEADAAATAGRARRILPVIAGGAGHDHPDGRVRLGEEVPSRKPFDLSPSELAHHVFLPGASGSGKTTTLLRLAHGALALGYGVVFVDCKGAGLGPDARELAKRYQVPYTVVDPDDPDTIGYDTCSGDAASVANKLLGAFSYEGAAEIYKMAAGQAIPPIVRALQASGRPVTLNALTDALRPGGMGRLGREAGEPHQTILADIESTRRGAGVGDQAYTGLSYRLGMLLNGKFGDVFAKTPALDWDAALAQPRVTYLALSATAASEDVELLGRVIAQDLKQACSRRLRTVSAGGSVPPVLAIIDEFAALREAEQIVDLLLQARQARVQCVIATQYLPEKVPIRKACLSAGLILAHRVEGEDAEALAGQFGTRTKWDHTLQIDRTTGQSEKGSVRRVDVYNVHPNELRELAVGRVAVRSVVTDRRATVQVYRD